MPDDARDMPLEFDAIRSEADLRAFVARFRLKALSPHPASAHTLGEWTGSVGGQAVFLRSRRLAAPYGPRSAWVQRVSLSIGTAGAGPLAERQLDLVIA